MKILKTVMTMVFIITISILAGCGDELISPAGQNTFSEKSSVTKPETSNDIERYHSSISLKPHNSHTYTYENTGYYKFNSISILNCGNTKGSLEISGYSDDQAFILGCNSKGFEALSIIIVNTTNETVDLDVFLTGSKIRTGNSHPPYKLD
ncbi:MAG TPA: hypothetical protein PKC91_07295 [Ignavibacteria bacterium]|nr:hypothetical protein [Ignavibacteria bacterium]